MIANVIHDSMLIIQSPPSICTGFLPEICTFKTIKTFFTLIINLARDGESSTSVYQHIHTFIQWFI